MLSIHEAITAKLHNFFSPVFIQVVDDSAGHSRGTETHFSVLVVSDLFAGVSRLERSRMVANLFAEERARGLHALSAKTFTAQEWDLVKDHFHMDAPACRGGSKV